MSQTTISFEAAGLSVVLSEHVALLFVAVLVGSLCGIAWTQLRKDEIITKLMATNTDLTATAVFNLPRYKLRRLRVRWEAVWSSGVVSAGIILVAGPPKAFELALVFGPVSGLLSVLSYLCWTRFIYPRLHYDRRSR